MKGKIIDATSGHMLWRDTWPYSVLVRKDSVILNNALNERRCRRKKYIARDRAKIIHEWIEQQRRTRSFRARHEADATEQESYEEKELKKILVYIKTEKPDPKKVAFAAEEKGLFFEIEREFDEVLLTEVVSDNVNIINHHESKLFKLKLDAVESDPGYYISTGYSLELPPQEENHLVGDKLVTIKTPWAWIIPALLDGAASYLGVCPRCEKIFTCQRTQKRYCSPTCSSAERFERWYNRDDLAQE